MSSVKKAIIPVAGLGTRFTPITKGVPKELLPIVDKPIIQYIVEEAVKSGIESIVFVSSKHKALVKDYFDPNSLYVEKITQKGKQHMIESVLKLSQAAEFLSVDQEEQKGLGHAILQAAPLIGSEPFAVILGDEVVKHSTPAIGQCLEIYNNISSDTVSVVGAVQVPKETVSSYGVLEFEDNAADLNKDSQVKIKSFVEKPEIEQAPSNWILPGRYVFSNQILNILKDTPADHRGEIQLTDAMSTLLNEQEFYATAIKGLRYDTGDKLGFLKANINEALEREDLGDRLRAWLKEQLNQSS